MKLESHRAPTPQRSWLLAIVSGFFVFTLGAAAPAAAQGSLTCPSPTLPDSTAEVLWRQTVAIGSGAAWQALRAKHGIPTLSAEDVSIVQDDVVCTAVIAAFASFAHRTYSESFAIVRLGRTAPFFYFMAKRKAGFGNSYLLNAQFTVLEILGTER